MASRQWKKSPRKGAKREQQATQQRAWDSSDSDYVESDKEESKEESDGKAMEAEVSILKFHLVLILLYKFSVQD